MPERFDAVVIGAGPGGEVVVERLAARGLRVAVVERELIGGECAYWACMPSKTLLRPPEVRAEARRAPGVREPGTAWSEIARHRDYMIRDLDDSKQERAYADDGVTVVRGAGRLAGPGRVEVGGRVLETERVVIATGSETAVPDVPGLAAARPWTNREATTLSEVPASAVVLGGGPVGIELGQMLARYGAHVTVVEAGERLLGREDPAVSRRLAAALAADGVDVRVGAEATGVSRPAGRTCRVGLTDGEVVEGEELVVASGRRPRTEDLGAESVGIELGDGGAIPVDERCRAAEGVWAVGDVTGVAPFTHVAKYQGRLTVADIAGEPVAADYRAVPRVVFSDPEVAAVGLTEEQAREQEIDLATAELELGSLARTETYGEDLEGELRLLADRGSGELVGAWAVGPLASEFIHLPVLAVRARVPVTVLRDTIPQFPTFSEGWQKALEALEL